MLNATKIIHEFDTAYGHYQVVDMVYDGRSARVLFSGNQQAAQSGVATDGMPDLLFDYNQRMYELVTGIKPKRLLLIGGGMYTLPSALLSVLPELKIDVVELDSGLDAVAAQYFNLQPNEKLQIVHDDGVHYLEQNTHLYDMILVDAYTHDLAEPTLGSMSSVELMKRSLKPGGSIAVNMIAALHGSRSEALMRLIQTYQELFTNVAIFPASQNLSLWLPQNLLIVASQEKGNAVDTYVRHQRLEPYARPFDIGRDLGI